MSGGTPYRRVLDLPAALPIFPLPGVLLLPRGKLPLNIFEPRYLSMVEHVMAGERLIGMVQPKSGESVAEGEAPEVYPVGCAGRITSYSETDDGRFLITLTGVGRFRILRELPGLAGYRRVEPDFAAYPDDLGPAAGGIGDRQRLINALKGYVSQFGLAVEWSTLEKTDDDRLVTALAMICPFEAGEKQALLEAPDLVERARLVTALIEMAVLGHRGGEALRH